MFSEIPAAYERHLLDAINRLSSDDARALGLIGQGLRDHYARPGADALERSIGDLWAAITGLAAVHARQIER